MQEQRRDMSSPRRGTECPGGQGAYDPWSLSKSGEGGGGRGKGMHRWKGEGERYLVPVSLGGQRDAGLQESARVTEGQGPWLLRSGSRRSYRNGENFY